ncbi:oxidoreductase [Enemella evansiae]|uniref:SDR family oxidoreductase n=1 Tax=Enemella evansiae TaxID=2016499 RepID=UPI000B97260E|nr:SDR family oxidoreductase [Enemella evansiae]OYN98019.1 oxidoreductase [Enemella evansiae]
MIADCYRSALVTGVSTGMGEAIARRLVGAGVTVTGIARNPKRLKELTAEIGITPLAVDLADTDALESAVAGLEVDVLVNNAGVSANGNVLDASRESVDAMVDVNLRAALHLCRLLVPGMAERDNGHVINISSIAGLYNFFGHTAYHATKAAVHQLSRQLRNDLAGRQVRVTEICPGRVETEIFGRNLGGTEAHLQEAWETYYAHYESVTTADIADVAEFALSRPKNVNLGMIEVMPTLQVPGGLQFSESR